MDDTLHLETEFEQYITRKLKGLSDSGEWIVSDNDTGYDREHALYFPDFVEFQRRLDPDKLAKMQERLGSTFELNVVKRLVASLEANGTVQTLRKGFPYAGFQTITCCAECPDNPLIRGADEAYKANILRVMRQVHYQTAGDKSLDLVFFINGIPVATAEIKTEMTQTVQDAIEEYQNERKPVEPRGGRKNYLLMFKRGAVVHFAISENEIWMCTNLEGRKPKFLPFNRGTEDGHAGNPPMKAGDKDYPTGYFWNDICQRDHWLRIFLHYIFVRTDKKEDATGRLKDVTTQYFPRFHQWDCVTKIIADVKEKGVGKSYLVEHSAGSGKTNTISWLADQLIRLRQANGDKTFDSVIIISDRNSLDTNIKGTIGQVEKTTGIVEMIGGTADKRTNGAKNKALVQALHDKREIIVVTLQTFPYAFETIANDKELIGSHYAVIIDEAHSSQTGIDAAKLKGALKLAHDEKKLEGDENGEVTDEEIINAYIRQEQAGRANPENVSFFAFTATPKAETMTLFGTPSDRIDDKTGEPVPVSFHKYPMRQAIEEGYILDVLEGYMPYKTAYQIGQTNRDEGQKLYDSRKAKKTIAQWMSLHPTNVKQKAKFIVDHFVKNVAPLLDGDAKAMVVTDSRAAVVRYKYAISAYLDAHPEYNQNRVLSNLRFKVLGEPLVAFSGKLKGEKAVHPDDADFETDEDYLQNPFALIKKDYDYTEDNMNSIDVSIESAFNEKKYRMLIVANKYQTGFDQPKLCAMYVDKPMQNDIEIVQTYSRLNRTHSGKDKVFIVDFVNDPETVINAFRKYDTGAQMESAQNKDIVYEIKSNLDDSGIYSTMEYTTYKNVRYQSILSMGDASKDDENRKKLYACLSAPAERWSDLYKAQRNAVITWHASYLKAKEAGNSDMVKRAEDKIDEAQKQIDVLSTFRKNLRKYCKAYTYISQIVDLNDPELEIFYGFCTLLSHRINGDDGTDVDINSLVMSDYRINKLDLPGNPDDRHTLRPMTAGHMTSGSKQEELDDIIRQINLIWGEDTPAEEGAEILNAIADKVSADEVSRTQIRNSSNSKDAIIQDGRLARIVTMAAMQLKGEEFTAMVNKILNDPQSFNALLPIIYDLVNNKTRFDVEAVQKAGRDSRKKK